MSVIYKVDFNNLNDKLNQLKNEYSTFSNGTYQTYLNGYLKNHPYSSILNNMESQLSNLYSNINNSYKQIIDWLDSYYTLAINIENVLAKNISLGNINDDNIRNYIENKLLNIEGNSSISSNIPKIETMGFNFFDNNDTSNNFSKSSSNRNYSKSDIKNKLTKDSMIEHKSKDSYWLNNHLMNEYSNEKSDLEDKFTSFIIKNERAISKIKSTKEFGFKSNYTKQELTKYVLENPVYFKDLLSGEEFKNMVGMTYEEYVEAIDTYNCQIATCKASMYATKQEQKQAQYVELMQSEDFLKFKSTISTEEAQYYCLTNLKYLGIDTLLASIGYLSDDETLLLAYLYQNEGKKSVKKFIGAYEDKINQAKGKAEADKYIAKITDDKAFSNFVTAMSNGVETKSIDDVKSSINLEFNETDQEILKEINECLFNYYTDAGLSNEYLVVNNENSVLAVVQTYTNLKNAYGIDIANTYVSNIEQCLNDCSLTLNISIKDGASKYFTTFGQGFGDGIESFTEGFENIFRTEGMISDNQYTQMYIASYLNGKTSLNLDYQISTSIGNMTPTVVLATLTGGTMQPVVTALNFASSFGNTYNQGLINGNNNMSSALNAVVVAGSDSVIEALAGGIEALKLKKAVGTLEDVAVKSLKGTLKDSLNSFVKGFVPNAFKEGGQEAFQSYLEAYSNKLFFGDEVDLAETSKEALYSATVGAFTASIMNSANFVSSLAQTITVHGINKEIEIGARIKFDNEIINGNIDLSQYNNVEEAFKSYITNNPDVMNFGSLKYIFNKMGNDFVSKVKQKTETAKENALNFIADNGGFVDLDGLNKKFNGTIKLSESLKKLIDKPLKLFSDIFNKKANQDSQLQMIKQDLENNINECKKLVEITESDGYKEFMQYNAKCLENGIDLEDPKILEKIDPNDYLSVKEKLNELEKRATMESYRLNGIDQYQLPINKTGNKETDSYLLRCQQILEENSYIPNEFGKIIEKMVFDDSDSYVYGIHSTNDQVAGKIYNEGLFMTGQSSQGADSSTYSLSNNISLFDKIKEPQQIFTFLHRMFASCIYKTNGYGDGNAIIVKIPKKDIDNYSKIIENQILKPEYIIGNVKFDRFGNMLDYKLRDNGIIYIDSKESALSMIKSNAKLDQKPLFNIDGITYEYNRYTDSLCVSMQNATDIAIYNKDSKMYLWAIFKNLKNNISDSKRNKIEAIYNDTAVADINEKSMYHMLFKYMTPTQINTYKSIKGNVDTKYQDATKFWIHSMGPLYNAYLRHVKLKGANYKYDGIDIENVTTYTRSALSRSEYEKKISRNYYDKAISTLENGNDGIYQFLGEFGSQLKSTMHQLDEDIITYKAFDPAYLGGEKVLVKGFAFEDKGFNSTTLLKENLNYRYGSALLKIQVKKGTNVSFVESNTCFTNYSQQELLLDTDLDYKIVGSHMEFINGVNQKVYDVVASGKNKVNDVVVSNKSYDNYYNYFKLENNHSSLINSIDQVDIKDFNSNFNKFELEKIYKASLVDIDEIYEDNNVVLHGEEHVKRVMQYALYIGKEENFSNPELAMLLDIAKFHDSGLNDEVDVHRRNQHGELAGLKVDEYLSSKYSENDLNIIKAAIDYHAYNDNENIFHEICKKYKIDDYSSKVEKFATILKDADALDRTRFPGPGDLDPTYLRTTEAKKLVMVSHQVQEKLAYDTINDSIRKNKYNKDQLKILKNCEKKGIPYALINFILTKDNMRIPLYYIIEDKISNWK